MYASRRRVEEKIREGGESVMIAAMVLMMIVISIFVGSALWGLYTLVVFIEEELSRHE
jgi:hypothetical protein